MIEFSCADYSFPLLSRRQSLELIHILEFTWVDIGLFERNANFLPSELMCAPREFTRRAIDDLHASDLRPADVFLQIGKEPAECSANDSNPTTRSRCREVFLRAVDFCAELGCAHMTGLPGVPHGHEEQDFDAAVEEATWRLSHCSKSGVAYAVEAHIGSICANTTSAFRLLSAVKGLTLTLDYGHFISSGEDSVAVHPLLPYTSHLHVRAAASGRLQTSLAENAIDFAAMMARLRSLNYPGKLALEYVWTKWQDCNLTDTLSETLLLRHLLHDYQT